MPDDECQRCRAGRSAAAIDQDVAATRRLDTAMPELVVLCTVALLVTVIFPAPARPSAEHRNATRRGDRQHFRE